jgi:hypothetical protein
MTNKLNKFEQDLDKKKTETKVRKKREQSIKLRER